MTALNDRITLIVDDHWPLDGGNHCDCGWSIFEVDTGHAAHVAEQITDLLLDLAGTGQLLRSIDQIARSS